MTQRVLAIVRVAIGAIFVAAALLKLGNDAGGYTFINICTGGGAGAGFHGSISFKGSVAVLMHMHRCPSARSGVAKRKGG